MAAPRNGDRPSPAVVRCRRACPSKFGGPAAAPCIYYIAPPCSRITLALLPLHSAASPRSLASRYDYLSSLLALHRKRRLGCGVCHSDLHVLKGELPFSTPSVVGHEITGEVVDHGTHTPAEIINRFPVESHVIGAFIMPCRNCFYCVKGQENLCESFFAYNRAKGNYDGETRLFLRGNEKPVYMYSMGGLAEYCVVPANALAVLPDSLSYTDSAILGCAVFTAYGALRHAAEMQPA